MTQDAAASSANLRDRDALSRIACVLALLLLAGAFLLVSPLGGGERPGVKPWAEHSALKQIIDALSFGGRLHTLRGVEIKDFVFYLGSAAGLLLLAARAALMRGPLRLRAVLRQPWGAGQVLLLAWVALSLASALWSDDPPLAIGQGKLYAFSVLWAVALAWTIERRHVAWLLGGLTTVSAVASTLTIWYFYERSPSHRPGFPIGNPGVLAACLLPAILFGLGTIGANLRAAFGGDKAALRQVGLCLVALVPLTWCFVLTDALSAKIGLLAGVAVLVLLQIRSRKKWLVVALAAAAAFGGVGYRFAKGVELASARGETAQFRLHTWRYATVLWQQRQWGGWGAGAYPRMAEYLARQDRLLEPGVFMGRTIGHAHNELFEVLAEIGLVGGVTFVAGHLAVFVTALGLMRGQLSRRDQTLLAVAAASHAALMTESMGNVALRLPVAPAVLYTVIGVVWAFGRTEWRGRDLSELLTRALGAPTPKAPLAKRLIAAGASLALAGGAFCAALVNWGGVLDVRDSHLALVDGRWVDATELAQRADAKLLDPVRIIEARGMAVDARYRRADEDLRELVAEAAASGSVDRARFDTVADELRTAYESAAQLNEQVPALEQTPSLAASAAERLSRLYGVIGRPEAADWRARAHVMWLIQRRDNPYHVEALLALTRFPGTLRQHVGYLRDALRLGQTSDPEWRATLERLQRVPGFEAEVDALVRAAGPYDPETDVNALVSCSAPECYRLSAAHRALNGEYVTAANQAAQAAALYKPMQRRFPLLRSVALAEEAEYVYRARPNAPETALRLAEEALAEVPTGDTPAHDAARQPFAVGYARLLLAAGDEAEARRQLDAAGLLSNRLIAALYEELVEWTIAQSVVLRPPIEEWLKRVDALIPDGKTWRWRAWLAAQDRDSDALQEAFEQAAQTGADPTEIEQARAALQERFPDAFQPTTTESPTSDASE